MSLIIVAIPMGRSLQSPEWRASLTPQPDHCGLCAAPGHPMTLPHLSVFTRPLSFRPDLLPTVPVRPFRHAADVAAIIAGVAVLGMVAMACTLAGLAEDEKVDTEDGYLPCADGARRL
ncbi:MAG: hypothetical protein LC808_10810 [Actinobacteria bacterium]|nr:hypothetical protein [Actinomycetota bacterium]